MRYTIEGNYYNGDKYSESFTCARELAATIEDIHVVGIDYIKRKGKSITKEIDCSAVTVDSDTLVITTEQD